MELPAACTGASGIRIQRRLLRWNHDEEKNVFVYAVLVVDIAKDAGKLEKSGCGHEKGDEGSNFGQRLEAQFETRFGE
ncbi:hypothetical protein PIB30_053520 [Stylosanthes scabra]|uniref:Uncharacterized protein n=1 Tax=Stylosanthes scabra TaxID=79078 RepID=A0ABU6UJC1_9FABA|nr:hypothetical protein [Stylosanthes scabra]